MKKLNTVRKFVATSAFVGALLLAGEVQGASAAAPNKIASDDLIIINKAYNQGAFYQDKELKFTFPVATGRTRDLTPEGKFKIVQKVVNRPYYASGIPGGDPRNPLGNRWLGIAVPGRTAAASWGGEYGIHGNNNPSSIGKYASSGCIRMLDGDIENKLYPNVLMNTPVYITHSYSSFAALTNEYGYIPAKTVAAAKPVVKTATVTATKETYAKGKLTGWVDGSSFEAKTNKGFKVFRTTNNWLKTNLKEGQTYTYYYTTNQYGQNIITKVNK